MKHSYHLDSLRGLLSLIVVLQHTAAAFIYSIDGVNSTLNTYMGLAAHFSVIFFFSLSGYVITISITENIKRNNAFKFSEYFLSRSIRIIPPLIGTILLSAIFLVLLQQINATHAVGEFKYFIRNHYYPDMVSQLKSIISLTISGNLTGGNNNVNGALWSLVYEIQFYVFAGLLSVMLTSKRTWLKLLCLCIAVLYVNKLDIKPVLNIGNIAFTCFAAGSICYIFKDLIIKLKVIPLVLFAAVIVTIGIQTGWENSIKQLRYNVDSTGNWMIYKIFLGCLFASLLIYVGRFGKLISPFNKISSFSYSLYITHFPVIVFLWFIIINYAKTALDYKYSLSIATVIACLLIAKYFSVLFEKPKQQREFITSMLNVITKASKKTD
ncbi:hypothetical protein EN46_02100 [Citrobacter amalonaticus]